ncbi:hypothetical protein MTO96_040912, partial [Rhipicephalus appendiculatus]
CVNEATYCQTPPELPIWRKFECLRKQNHLIPVPAGLTQRTGMWILLPELTRSSGRSSSWSTPGSPRAVEPSGFLPDTPQQRNRNESNVSEALSSAHTHAHASASDSSSSASKSSKYEPVSSTISLTQAMRRNFIRTPPETTILSISSSTLKNMTYHNEAADNAVPTPSVTSSESQGLRSEPSFPGNEGSNAARSISTRQQSTAKGHVHEPRGRVISIEERSDDGAVNSNHSKSAVTRCRCETVPPDASSEGSSVPDETTPGHIVTESSKTETGGSTSTPNDSRVKTWSTFLTNQDVLELTSFLATVPSNSFTANYTQTETQTSSIATTYAPPLPIKTTESPDSEDQLMCNTSFCLAE